MIAFANMTFFSNIAEIYPVNLSNIAFLVSLSIFFGTAIVLLLSLVCFKYSIKPVLISVLLISSSVSYFMDSYNVVIDDAMIRNTLNTNMSESMDLVSLRLLVYVMLLGIGPSFFIYKTTIQYQVFKKELLSRIKLIVLSFVTVILIVVVFGDFYASFFREHKSLRYYANPSFYIYSVYKYTKGMVTVENKDINKIGLDAKVSPTNKRRQLMILVVGETARADRFSLNGYTRETNPLLKNENLMSFSNFWACGTSTAVSVPCIFSMFGQDEFDFAKGIEYENILDVLNRAGVNLLWLDNNSDSKSVALRASYQSYKRPENNPVCDVECRDVGMLSNIQAYVENQKQGSIFIVLHQMGNHGPAYYKRYPSEFKKFTPVCETNQLEK